MAARVTSLPWETEVSDLFVSASISMLLLIFTFRHPTATRVQDFHQFACGGFLKDVTIPQGHSMFTLIGSKIDTQVVKYITITITELVKKKSLMINSGAWTS